MGKGSIPFLDLCPHDPLPNTEEEVLVLVVNAFLLCVLAWTETLPFLPALFPLSPPLSQERRGVRR
jgi:hypothetical protein